MARAVAGNWKQSRKETALKALISTLSVLALLTLLTVPAFARGVGAIDSLPICEAVRNTMAASSIAAMVGYVGIRYRLLRG